MQWHLSDRGDQWTRIIADNHYNRQKKGAKQFVPPGRCLVLITHDRDAFWVTSWPFAEYTKHAWAGAWVCSAFRNEAPDKYLSSALITQAIAATRAVFGPPPDGLGMVTFVDPTKVRHKRDLGRCYRKAGFKVAGETKVNKLVALQLLPDAIPEARAALPGRESQVLLF